MQWIGQDSNLLRWVAYRDPSQTNCSDPKISVALRCRIGTGLSLAFPDGSEAYMRSLLEGFFACPY